MVGGAAEQDRVVLVLNAGWDARILVCRCAPTVDAFIVVTARYVVLIDTLINPATARTMLALARPHLTTGRTLLVVNTHADWDHCWGNQLFVGPDAEMPAPEGRLQIEVNDHLVLALAGAAFAGSAIDSVPGLLKTLSALRPERLVDLNADFAALHMVNLLALHHVSEPSLALQDISQLSDHLDCEICTCRMWTPYMCVFHSLYPLAVSYLNEF